MTVPTPLVWAILIGLGIAVGGLVVAASYQVWWVAG